MRNSFIASYNVMHRILWFVEIRERTFMDLDICFVLLYNGEMALFQFLWTDNFLHELWTDVSSFHDPFHFFKKGLISSM